MGKIYDSVHGFIHFNELEQQLIDTAAFQRLHYIHQLGISYLVYPGGTHTRFEHSLGTMALATLIFDHIHHYFPNETVQPEYWRQILRFAALCHDLGHLPFSHVAEKRLLGTEGHEHWTAQVIASPELKAIWRQFGSPEKDVEGDVTKMALGMEKAEALGLDLSFSKWERVLSQVIAGDFFGADRIDYLLRDAKSTGLSYGLFDYSQLIEMLRLIPQEDGGWELGVEENGLESCEALLLARYFMQKRLYQHPSSKAYSFHLARFMEGLYQDPKYTSELEAYLSMSEPEVLCALFKAAKDPGHPHHLDAKCLHSREKRFQAIPLPETVQEETLKAFKAERGIPDGQIEWNLVPLSKAAQQPSLPVFNRSQKIPSSHLLRQIPPARKNWLFLAPQYTFSLF